MRRDYQRKKFRNPLFPRKDKAARPKRRVIYLVLLLILISVGLFWVNQSSEFTVRYIDVVGTEQISKVDVLAVAENQLEKSRFLFFDQSNIFFFKKSVLKKELFSRYQIQKVKVKKKYFDTILVEIIEKPIALVWLSENQKYYLDKNGIATTKVGETSNLVVEGGGEGTEIIRSDSKTLSYPTIADQNNRPVEIGTEAVLPTTAEFLIALHQGLLERADFDISHYTIISPAADEITMVTKEGWQAHFNLTDLPETQVERLFLILQNRVDDRDNLEYIDLRFGEKIFYK